MSEYVFVHLQDTDKAKMSFFLYIYIYIYISKIEKLAANAKHCAFGRKPNEDLNFRKGLRFTSETSHETRHFPTFL